MGRSPISSRKIVPPSADSKRPKRRCSAPVKEPFSCPKSSDAIIGELDDDGERVAWCDARYRGPGFIPLASIILLASGERRKSRKTFAVSVSFAPDTKKA